MKYIMFKDEKISKLSLGTVQFGLDYGISNFDGKPTQKNVSKICDYVTENGINCFDTAQAYGNSEEVIGKALKEQKDIYLISKLKSDLFTHNVVKNINSSLKNLQTDSLYALLLHDCNLLYNWKEDYSSIVEELIESRKIKYFGVSIYTNEDFELAIKNEKIQFIQIPFNIFDQRAIKNKWFEKAHKHNKLIFIRSIFLQGLLLMDSDKLPSNLKIANKYLKIFELYCKELQMSKSELALNFVDSLALNSLILFGCENLNQAKENIKNYNSLKPLDNFIVQRIINSFENIDETIYNPTKWLP